MIRRVKLLQQSFHGFSSYLEPLQRAPLIEIISNNRVLIENHHGVSSYTKKEISIRVSNGLAIICGEELTLVHLMKGRMIITGSIKTIQLSRME